MGLQMGEEHALLRYYFHIIRTENAFAIPMATAQ
jgi:hypothetical protein